MINDLINFKNEAVRSFVVLKAQFELTEKIMKQDYQKTAVKVTKFAYLFTFNLGRDVRT